MLISSENEISKQVRCSQSAARNSSITAHSREESQRLSAAELPEGLLARVVENVRRDNFRLARKASTEVAVKKSVL